MKHLFVLLFSSLFIQADQWLILKEKDLAIYYTESDKVQINEYKNFIITGIKSVKTFFKGNFKSSFSVYVHPSRASLDKQWQKDWNMPDFKSERWMVASGVAQKLDLISPKVWNEEACDHSSTDNKKTQQLITHELVHVYHGQFNPSPDFSNVTKLDWFVEGLATYASRQCDTARIRSMKNDLDKKGYPSSLDQFWTGKHKYGLSGSVVMYIDKKYGRKKLISLLKLTDLTTMLKTLDTDEAVLLKGWKLFLDSL